MSTETNTPVESMDTDLDTFASELFGQSKPASETTNSEEDKADVEDSDATEEIVVDTQSETEADEAEDEDTEDDADEAKDETPKPKKNRAQERISELNAKWREEQRIAEELRAEVERLKNPIKQNTPTTPAKDDEAVPTPFDKNEDGTDRYRLGEFDPQFIADLADYRFESKIKSYEQKQQDEAKQREDDAQRATVVTEWNSKLEPVRERYPDFQEKGQELIEGLTGLTQDYEDYISATIMSMEYGPDVLYYLASNPDEAQAIINGGPTKTAIALGRIEAKFAVAAAEKTLARPKTSAAPVPPPTNRGTSVAKPAVAPDTDDLRAFESAFFRKK